MANVAKYNSDYHDDWAWSLALQGATDEDIANAFGITRRTVLRWRENYPSFDESLKRGKEIADSKVERSLYKKAIGYDYTESENIVEIDPKTGGSKPVRIKKTNKHVAPDTMAIMYWLNNRKRAQWCQKQEISVKNGNAKGDVVIYMPAVEEDDEE